MGDRIPPFLRPSAASVTCTTNHSSVSSSDTEEEGDREDICYTKLLSRQEFSCSSKHSSSTEMRELNAKNSISKWFGACDEEDHNYLSALDKYVKAGGNINATDKDGRTILFYATWQGRLAAVKFLLANKADIYIVDECGRTPLHEAWENEHLAISLSLQDFVGIDLPVASKKYHSLSTSAWFGRLEIMNLLVQKGINVNHQDNGGMTPLHWAVLNGRPEIVRLLIDLGANGRIKNDQRMTALDLVAIYKHVEIERLLSRLSLRQPIEPQKTPCLIA